ncbi:hypothetical protein T484DRAFT_1745577 [Baffinella frigidus]|nr:hypothetical protein T484DRAFT_1745577 [Cryptophyta sp. CCMP2293]
MAAIFSSRSLQRVMVLVIATVSANMILFASRRQDVSIRVTGYADGLVNRLDHYRDRVADQLDRSEKGGVPPAVVPADSAVLGAPAVPAAPTISATSESQLPNPPPAIPASPIVPAPPGAAGKTETSHSKLAGVLEEQTAQMAKLSEVLPWATRLIPR